MPIMIVTTIIAIMSIMTTRKRIGKAEPDLFSSVIVKLPFRIVDYLVKLLVSSGR